MRRRMMENRVSWCCETTITVDIERDIGHARNSFDLFVYVVGYEMIFN